ncbi:C4-dicarboxylate ABC transporter permease [Sporosarcina sp. P18a]|uniref:TRAP transporter large permease n=1 Tax=unclassified Sporosarcina TaxID=2647733 RepID=UPI000C16F33B|nr:MULTISPECIES: TRAP transporter large permease subunit [unclassified Sporosarcina]PIC70204.1 C4-dicarboxylate ABC transporter permease [Sporosarcina sp. P16b]PIC79086.1 C4-dicarboxylate ABC transporter permease [Sporosarcina sp. P18a]PID01771.1 C4-dicarboxylate ABC transporter permease [Sporosarcina sp. P2]
MEWWGVLALVFGSMFILFMIGLPIAFSFLTINIVGVIVLWNGEAGLNQLILNIFSSVSKFSLLPIPMFILMGEIMFRTGLGFKVFDAVGKWFGNLPGRLSIVAVGSGTLFSVLSGSSVASTALLGSLLVPDMQKKGYSPAMTVGPILGSAGLATMIPPTALGILLASLASIPVGHFLFAIVVPGLLLAVIFVLYIIIRCYFQPELAPAYDVEKVPLSEKLIGTVKYILPLGFIVFLLLGVIILGIATPTQSAVLGALGTIVLSYFYGGLTWAKFWDSLTGTLRSSVMIFMIIIGSTTFGQILSYTGVTQGLVQLVGNLEFPPLIVLVIIQIVLLILGCFMEPLSIMMMTLPILMPIAGTMGFDPLWFGAIMLLNMQVATITPPFGMDLFAMKAVIPKDSISMKEIYSAVVPFILLNLAIMALMIIFPSLTLWLPSFVK